MTWSMKSWKYATLSAALVAGVAAAPLSSAEAHGRHHGGGVWPLVAGAAILGTFAAIAGAQAQAPAPYYYPPTNYYYPPAQGYYGSGYYQTPYGYGSPY